MMEKGKRVRLIAETQFDDGSGDMQVLRHAGYGELTTDGSEFRLAYEDLQEGERISICLTGTKEQVLMQRTGEAKGEILFVPGQETGANYVLPYGEIEFCIRTTLIETTLNETEGGISLIYESGADRESMNRVRYTCRWKS